MVKVFLDFDGTINNSFERAFRVYKNAVSIFGGIPLDYGTFLYLKRNKVSKSILLGLSSIDSFKSAKFDKCIFNLIEEEQYLQLDNLFEWVKSFLNSLMFYGVELNLLTARHKARLLHKQLMAYKITEFFSTINVVEDKTSFINKKMQRKTDLIIIGDTETEIKAAKKNKIVCVSVTWGMRSLEYLKLMEPNFIVNNENELLDTIKAILKK